MFFTEKKQNPESRAALSCNSVLQHLNHLSSLKRKLSLSLCVQTAHLWRLLQSSGDRHRRSRPDLQRERGRAPQTGGVLRVN